MSSKFRPSSLLFNILVGVRLSDAARTAGMFGVVFDKTRSLVDRQTILVLT